MASEAHLHAWEQRLRDWETELEALSHITNGLGEIQFRDHLLHLPVEKIQCLQLVLEGHGLKKKFCSPSYIRGISLARNLDVPA